MEATNGKTAKINEGIQCGLMVAINGATIAPILAPAEHKPKAMVLNGVGNNSDIYTHKTPNVVQVAANPIMPRTVQPVCPGGKKTRIVIVMPMINRVPIVENFLPNVLLSIIANGHVGICNNTKVFK